MRLVNTKAHGIIDFILGLIILTSPWTFHLANVADAKYVMLFTGALTIVFSLLTKFESGLIKFIGLKTHLLLDFLSGAFLAGSPWLIGFNNSIFKPHLVFGLGLIFLSLLTDRILYKKLSHELN